ncbi:MAG: erythromycin esterase family protein [Marinilabiliaceae bacterium]|nr:erythromycin esterase family protein [Marinilabiliaceae bacterium]
MKIRFTLVAVVCLLVTNAFGQTELVNELNNKITEITSITPDGNFDDLKSLKGILSNKKIIGLGEATHGTREFFTFKHRMMKYLVENENFKVFIIEGDFAGAQAMNDYVIYGKGTSRDGFIGVGYGVWCRQAFVDFVEWIKEYNQDKLLEDKVKFYGCDINNEKFAAKNIKTYLANGNKLNESLSNELNIIIQGELRKKLSETNTDYKEQLFSALEDAFNSLKDEESREKTFIEHCKRELEQKIEIILSDRSRSIVLRDKFMAENIEWIYQYENMQKSVFWAHNEHIKIDNANSNFKPTGYYLKEKFADSYYSFGLAFNNGEVGGFNRKKKKYDSFKVPSKSPKKLCDAVFSQCIYPNFVLDFTSVNSNDVISEFLNTNLYQRTIGAGFYPDGKTRNHFRWAKLIDKYDGLIFIKETNPARQIKETTYNK